MKDKNVVIGKTYRVKAGLPDCCWGDICLDKDAWENDSVTVRGLFSDEKILHHPDGYARPTTTWAVHNERLKRGNCWLPTYALAESCMFQ